MKLYLLTFGALLFASYGLTQSAEAPRPETPAVSDKRPIVLIAEVRADNGNITKETDAKIAKIRYGSLMFFRVDEKLTISPFSFMGDRFVPDLYVFIPPSNDFKIPQDFIDKVLRQQKAAVAENLQNLAWKETTYPEAFQVDGLGPLSTYQYNEFFRTTENWKPAWDEEYNEVLSELNKDPTNRKNLTRAMDFFWSKSCGARAVPFVERYLAAGGTLMPGGYWKFVDNLARIGRVEDARKWVQRIRQQFPGYDIIERSCQWTYVDCVYYFATVKRDLVASVEILVEAERQNFRYRPNAQAFVEAFIKAVKENRIAGSLHKLDAVWNLLWDNDAKRCLDTLRAGGIRPPQALLDACDASTHLKNSSYSIIGRCWTSVIGAEFIGEQLDKALAIAQAALAAAETEGQPIARFNALLNLVEYAQKSGALETECTAVDALLKLGGELGGAYAGWAKHCAGNMHEQLADYPSAIKVYKEVVTWAREHHEDELRGSAENFLARAESLHGAAIGAEQHLRKSVEWSERYGNIAGHENHNLGICLREQGKFEEAARVLERASRGFNNQNDLIPTKLALGQVYLRLKQPDKAEAQFEFAADRYAQLKGSRDHWIYMLGKAQVRKQKGDTAGAEEWIAKCLSAIETQRASLKDYHHRRTLWNNKYDAYDIAIEIALAKNDHKAAFQLAERSRSRALMDELGARFKAVPANPLIDLDSLQPVCAGFTVIVFFQCQERLLAWIVNQERAELVSLPVTAKETSTHVANACATLSGQRQPAGEQHWKASLQTLHQKIWAALASKLPKGTRLCIIPHQHLHYVPFQALHDGQAFLVEKHDLFYAPSGSALAALLTRPVRKNDFMVLFDPIVSADPKSPFHITETKEILALYPKASTFKFEKATVKNFKHAVLEAGIAHISAHGYYDAALPLNSGLLFNSDNKDRQEILRAQEIYEMKLSDCQLMVMSACVSSVGELAGGDEVTGLTRAFQAAGVPNVIGTLWPVKNEPTTRLMTAFYGHLSKKENDPVQALCEAQRQFLKTDLHPSHWAAFQVSGTGKPPTGDAKSQR